MSIKEILSHYITERDNAARSGQSVFISGTHGLQAMQRFSNMINQHHMQLFEELPTLNLAELEALAELVNSRLSYVRHLIQSGN